jgi:hypothetical protein
MTAQRWWFVIAVVIWSGPHAEDQQCQQSRANTVPQALRIVNEIDSRIEQVPPQQEEYLSTEMMGAMQTHSVARYNMLATQPYYAAWQLHGSLERVKNELTGMDQRRYGESLEHTQVKAASFALARIPFAVQDYMAYTRVDVRRKSRVLNDADQEKFGNQLGRLGLALATYINCTVDAMK